MKTFFTILLATLCAATGYGQTMKALSYNTSNNQVFANIGTNNLTFTNNLNIAPSALLRFDGGNTHIDASGFYATQFGSFLSFEEQRLRMNDANVFEWDSNGVVTFGNVAATRTNLALGASNIVTFAGLTNNGDITINSTTASNGLLFIRRTNNEAFLGLANLIASNNTTISNETLFRVGTAEATNRSAQFGFRSTNTNGSGVAVFSVFGFNALMQIGADASTNAVIYSGGGTNNQVMTLIKSGATEFARPISFANTTNAAITRTNVGLPLAALTNTSNVTMMRALAGSTNTNQPYSGAVELSDGIVSWLLTFSNGILLKIDEI
jgi:hypothetical protein